MSGLKLACRTILYEVHQRLRNRHTPLLVALDGGSGSGKSTLALMIQQALDAALIPSDDFFAAHITDAEWAARTAKERARDGIDWRRLRTEAVAPLRAGLQARWHPFDFVAGVRADGTYAMSKDYIEVEPKDVIILDGAYSARPELADLIDLAVLVDVPVAVRHARLTAREEAGFLAAWHKRWDVAEVYYFNHVRLASSFDLVVLNDQT